MTFVDVAHKFTFTKIYIQLSTPKFIPGRTISSEFISGIISATASGHVFKQLQLTLIYVVDIKITFWLIHLHPSFRFDKF